MLSGLLQVKYGDYVVTLELLNYTVLLDEPFRRSLRANQQVEYPFRVETLDGRRLRGTVTPVLVLTPGSHAGKLAVHNHLVIKLTLLTRQLQFIR